MPPQAETVSLAVKEEPEAMKNAPEARKPRLRLLTYPQLLVSSTLVQLPRSNLYWNDDDAAPEMVSVHVSVPVLIIGISVAPQSCDDFMPVPSALYLPLRYTVSPLGVSEGTVTLITAWAGPHPFGPAQLATESLTVPPFTDMERLLTLPQLAVSSTLAQLPPSVYL